MPLRNGYSRSTIAANIRDMVRAGHPQANAIAAAHQYARMAWRKRYPGEPYPHWIYPPRQSRNPIHDRTAAETLATKFHGRFPEFDSVFDIGRMPDTFAGIGRVAAIEYIAERDGKFYRFRHDFRSKARPHLGISPDGLLAVMVGGPWRFTEDGFEDQER